MGNYNGRSPQTLIGYTFVFLRCWKKSAFPVNQPDALLRFPNHR